MPDGATCRLMAKMYPHGTVGWAIYWDCDLGQEKMSRRVAKILPTPSTSGMMSKNQGKLQKFTTALVIYFWTSKHEKLAKKRIKMMKIVREIMSRRDANF